MMKLRKNRRKFSLISDRSRYRNAYLYVSCSVALKTHTSIFVLSRIPIKLSAWEMRCALNFDTCDSPTRKGSVWFWYQVMWLYCSLAAGLVISRARTSSTSLPASSSEEISADFCPFSDTLCS